MTKAPPISNTRPHDARETIIDDRLCASCNYNLRGLPATGVCPECGAENIHAVHIGSFGSRVTDNSELGLASNSYLVPLILALTVIALTSPAIAAIGLATWNGSSSAFTTYFGLVAGAFWFLATLILCRDRPRIRGSHRHRDDADAWPVKLLAVLSQPLWIALPVLAEIEAGGAAWAGPGKMICFVLAGFSAGSVPFLAALTAEWAFDFALMGRLRGAAWIVSAASLAMGLLWLIALTKIPPAIFAIGFGAVSQILWALAMVAVSLFSLSLLIDIGWATVNSGERLARDSRINARRRAHAAALAVPPPITEAPASSEVLSRLEPEDHTPPAPEPDDLTIACQLEKHHIERPPDVVPYPLEAPEPDSAPPSDPNA